MIFIAGLDFHHWLHWKLSEWQISMPLVMGDLVGAMRISVSVMCDAIKAASFRFQLFIFSLTFYNTK